MDKMNDKQAQQAITTRRIYNAVDKVGNFARKLGPPALTVLLTVVTLGIIKSKGKKS